MSQKTVRFRKDRSRRHRCRRRPRMHHHVHATFGQAGPVQAYRLSDATPQPVPPDGFPQLAAHRDAKAGTSNAVPQIDQLNPPAAQRLSAGIDPPVLFRRQQATRFWETPVQGPTRSGSQTLAALGATAFDNQPPRPGPHSSPEAVGLGALAIVGTKGRPHKHPEGSSPVLLSRATSYSTGPFGLSIRPAGSGTLEGSFWVEPLPPAVVSFTGFQQPLFYPLFVRLSLILLYYTIPPSP